MKTAVKCAVKWLWKKKIVLLAFVLMGVLVHMVYRKLLPAEAGFAMILGPLVWLAEGHRQKQEHQETQRQIATAKSEMRQHLLHSTGETVDKIRDCKEALCQHADRANSTHAERASALEGQFEAFRKQLAKRPSLPKRK